MIRLSSLDLFECCSFPDMNHNGIEMILIGCHEFDRNEIIIWAYKYREKYGIEWGQHKYLKMLENKWRIYQSVCENIFPQHIFLWSVYDFFSSSRKKWVWFIFKYDPIHSMLTVDRNTSGTEHFSKCSTFIGKVSENDNINRIK